MGYYSIYLNFGELNREVDIFRGMVNCASFKPKAIGAITLKKEFKRHSFAGFLSGWALEIFGRHYSDKLVGCPLTTFSAGEGNVDYLSSIVKKIYDGTLSSLALSPFEEKDDEYLATFLSRTAEFLMLLFGVILHEFPG